jgi:hypothetical protein
MRQRRPARRGGRTRPARRCPAAGWRAFPRPGHGPRRPAHLGHLRRYARTQGYIHQFDRRSGKFQRRLEITDGVRYHPGGMAMHGGSIWVPVAEYRANSSAVLVEIDKQTLTIRRGSRSPITWAAWRCRGAAWSPAIGTAGCSTSSTARAASQGDQEPLPDPLSGPEVRPGRLVGSGALGPKAGAIDWFAWPSMKQDRQPRGRRYRPRDPLHRGRHGREGQRPVPGARGRPQPDVPLQAHPLGSRRTGARLADITRRWPGPRLGPSGSFP